MHVTVYIFSVISTVTELQNCVTATISPIYNAYENLINMSSVAEELSQEAQAAENILNVFSLPAIIQNITSLVTTIATSLPSDITELTTGIPGALTQISECATNVTVAASNQLLNIFITVQNCINPSG